MLLHEIAYSEAYSQEVCLNFNRLIDLQDAIDKTAQNKRRLPCPNVDLIRKFPNNEIRLQDDFAYYIRKIEAINRFIKTFFMGCTQLLSVKFKFVEEEV